MDDLVFLFDVDNTLLDNDRVQQDLDAHLASAHGEPIRKRYWTIYEERFAALGYADYFGALERLRVENPHEPRMLELGPWLIDYPFAERLYPGALDAVAHARAFGRVVLLSDGDAVYQPRKVQRSGLFAAAGGQALIFVHKEQELAFVERRYPAKRYVLIDDKLRILTAIKAAWGDRVLTVFPRQGRYAHDEATLAACPKADLSVEAVGNFVALDRGAFAP